GEPDQDRLLDIKEVRLSILLSCTDAPQPDTGGDEARRVVAAQRQLQAHPPAGLDVLPIGTRTYRMREMIPDENRAQLSPPKEQPARLRRAVAVAGRLTGWSHIRGSRFAGEDRSDALARWVEGPGLDAVIASAVRYAEQARRDFKQFHRAYASLRADRRIA